MFCFRDYLQYLKYDIVILENGLFYGFYNADILEFYSFVFCANIDRNTNKRTQLSKLM